MTDFALELRHRCRNPKCRSKLPKPVANEHHAFCTRGCRASAAEAGQPSSAAHDVSQESVSRARARKSEVASA
jgi:hypothetical protein